MTNANAQKNVRELVLAVFETNGRLVDAGNALVQPLGLTTAWWQVLGALGYSQVPLPVAHIARNMGLTRQAVATGFILAGLSTYLRKGGLVSLAIGLQYPNVFGRLAIMSPSVFWQNRAILADLNRFPGKFTARAWVDIGTAEGNNPKVTVETKMPIHVTQRSGR